MDLKDCSMKQHFDVYVLAVLPAASDSQPYINAQILGGSFKRGNWQTSGTANFTGFTVSYIECVSKGTWVGKVIYWHAV